MKDANPSRYFAQEAESSACVGGLIERIRRYRESLRSTGRADRMRRAWMAYQGWGPRMDTDATRLNPAGEQGEMLQVSVNHFAALVNQAVVLTTSNKPAIVAIPANEDYDSRAQAAFAESLNDYYDRELAISDREQDGTLGMVLMSEAFIVLDWDANAGEPYATKEDGGTVFTGDVRVLTLTPFDVGMDPDVQDAESHTWAAFRRRVNKYDLAARFPALASQILATRREDETFDAIENATMSLEFRRRRSTAPESDCVYLWELRHKPTPAVPKGRIVRFIDAECVLYDSVGKTQDGQAADFGYPFGSELFLYSAAPERIPGTPDGHTSFFDILSLQEAIDLTASIMASAINAGGLQNLYVPRGANVTADKLTGALNVIEYDGPTVPKAESNVAINDAIPAFAEMCIGWARQRVSMNDVVMGEPTKGMPAQAMALLRAQAVEFHSRLQAAYERLVQRTRTGILQLLQKYATVERVSMVAGKSNAWAVRAWKAGSIAKVKGYVTEPINPAMKTLAGRVGFFQPMVESGAITIEEYFDVVQTGRYVPRMRFSRDNQARIEREKELLMQGVGLPPIAMGPMGPVLDAQGAPVFVDDGQGRYVRPLITDTHWLDIPEALGVLAMPEVRDNPAVVKAVTEVVHLRMQLWRQMDPAIIMLLGGTPPPPLMGPPMMAGGTPPPHPGGGPTQTRPPAPGEGDVAGPSGAQVPLPKPPKNPLTGEQDLPA